MSPEPVLSPLSSAEYADPAQTCVEIADTTHVRWSFFFGHLAGFIVNADYDGNITVTCSKCNKDDELGQERISYRPVAWKSAEPMTLDGHWIGILVRAAMSHRCPEPTGGGAEND
jgi:hypothetical protein